MGRSALIAAVLLAAACSSGTSFPPIERPDGGIQCQQGGSECPPGTRCSNRLCAATCAGGAACSDPATYCEGTAAPEDICALKEPRTCTTFTDCPSPQDLCFQGLCSSFEVRADGGFQACTPFSVNDTCGPDAVCYVIDSKPTCVGLSACSEDGGCPGTSIGEVCNRRPDGGQLIAGKERICVVRYCDVDADCNSGARCWHGFGGVPFGWCSQGGPGDQCFVTADCYNTTECRAATGSPDDGGTPGFCACNPNHDAGVDAGSYCP